MWKSVSSARSGTVPHRSFLLQARDTPRPHLPASGLWGCSPELGFSFAVAAAGAHGAPGTAPFLVVTINRLPAAELFVAIAGTLNAHLVSARSRP